MKIVHVCLSCFYIDGFAYQENILVKEHVKMGHDVTVLASTENYQNGKLCYVQPSSYMGADGAKVTRLPYSKLFPHKIMTKLRVHPHVYEYLTDVSPDIIVFHGLCGWELRTICRFKLNHPNVTLWVDSHEDFNNSARNLFSKILHKLYYKRVINSVIHVIDKVLCVSLDTMDFVSSMYRVHRDKLFFYPLGAQIPTDELYYSYASEIRAKYNICDDEILIVQTGKQTKRKCLVESLLAFSKTNSQHLKFIIAGNISDEINKECMELIEKDSRIQFIGWQSSEELGKLLCGSDVYLQPGTQSATMQASLGARCIVVLDDVKSHEPFVNKNGWLLNSEMCITTVFGQLESLNKDRLVKMQECSLLIAKELLDYKKLASYLVR